MAKRIAHRGVKSEYLENTPAAFARALDVADGIELDVQIAKCGTAVVFHDDTLERLFDATGSVAEYTARQLATLKPNPDHDLFLEREPTSDEYIPTLDAVLDQVPSDYFLNVEIKAGKLALSTPTSTVAKMLTADRNVIVSCFNPVELMRFNALNRRIPTGLLFGADNGFALRYGWITKGLRHGSLSAIHPEWKLVSPDLVQRAKNWNLDINVWTVNDIETANWLDDLGVTAIISDRPHQV